MKLKNTLGLAIGSLIAATSFGVLAQGQGAVEGELFYKKQYNDSVNHIEDGFNPGARIGYFLTDDLSLDLSYDKTNHTRRTTVPVARRSKAIPPASWPSITSVKLASTPCVHT